MLCRLLPLGMLLLAFCLGCNTAPKEPAAEDAEHADHDHEHGEHGHDDHGHEGHDHAAHDGHDHVAIESYDQAVEMIETARNTIRDGLAAGEKEKADEALHKLGHTLEHVGELTGDFADDVRVEIKKDVDELFELFDKVDQQIHAGEEVTYDTVSEKIDAVIERLHGHAHKDEPATDAAPE